MSAVNEQHGESGALDSWSWMQALAKESGEATFYAKCIVRATIAAGAVGVVCVAAAGPGLPFLAGSSAGFVASMYHTWTEETAYALSVNREFPDVIRAAMMRWKPYEFYSDTAAVVVVDSAGNSFSSHYERRYRVWERSLRAGNLRSLGEAVVATHSVSGAVMRLRNARLDDIVERYQASYSTRGSQRDAHDGAS